jgi:hypothetical protein
MSSRQFETVLLLMARCRIMQTALGREERLLRRRMKGRPSTLADGWPFVTYFNLYLANMHVLIESWDRALFYDDKVHELLTPQLRTRLRRFRNSVFHAGPFNDKPVQDVWGKYREWRERADELLDAVAQFMKREFSVRQVAKLRPPS